MTPPDLFGPYPASAPEREGRILAVFGADGPFRQTQMRAVRHRCPGCREGTGRQCTQQRPGGARRPRRVCHPSRVAVSFPCAPHARKPGEECPGEHGLPGICADREDAAKDALAVHASGLMADVARRNELDKDGARRQADYLRTKLDPSG